MFSLYLNCKGGVGWRGVGWRGVGWPWLVNNPSYLSFMLVQEKILYIKEAIHCPSSSIISQIMTCDSYLLKFQDG